MKRFLVAVVVMSMVMSVTGVNALTVKKPDGSIQIFTDTPLEGLVISANGNIGMGTLAPTVKLDVSGNVNIKGIITATSFVGSGAGLTGVVESDPLVRAYAKTKNENELSVASANIAVTANKLAVMTISQFTNDSGFLATESDPSVRAYAKNKNENELSVASSNIAVTANKLAVMTISQFTNDSGYLATESDPTVKSYAKTKEESQLSVALAASANLATTANVALAMNASGLTGALNINASAAAAAVVVAATGYVGVGALVPTSKLSVNGSLSTAISTKTSNTNLTALDSVVLASAAASALVMTLPSAVGIDGRQYTIKKVDASKNKVTIQPTGTEKIDLDTLYVLTQQFEFVIIVSDGTNWVVVGNN